MLARTTLHAALRNPCPYRRAMAAAMPAVRSSSTSQVNRNNTPAARDPFNASIAAPHSAAGAAGTLSQQPTADARRRPLTALGSRLRTLFRRSLRSGSTLSSSASSPPVVTNSAGAATTSLAAPSSASSRDDPVIPESESQEMTQYRIAEQALLSYLPPDLDWRLHQVRIPREFWKGAPDSPLATAAASGKACHGTSAGRRWRTSSALPECYEINTLTVTGKKGRATATEKPHLVLVHGWGGALGMWLRNLEELSEHYTVHAIDLLGWGGSSRPPFSSIYPSASSMPSLFSAFAAQAYMVDSLEAWRAAQSLPAFHLVGHSMGGFISASYFLRFPHRLTNLTLVSPIGLQGFPAPATASLRAKLHAALVHQAWQFTPQRLLVHVLGKERTREMVMRARTRIARMFGGGGDKEIPPSVIVDYLLAGMHRAPGVAGEAAFAKLGSPTRGWAVPLDVPLRTALTSSVNGLLEDGRGSVAIAYGVSDWIDPRYALWELQPSVRAAAVAARLEVYLVEGAGHHAYVENARAVNDIVLRRRERVREARDEPGLVAEMVRARAGSGFMSVA